MLLTVPGTVCSLKMLSGDEVVGKFVKKDAGNYVINRPLICVLTPQGMALTQWMLTADINQDFSIPESVVLNMSQTRKEIADEYVRTTTGIRPAGGGLLTP